MNIDQAIFTRVEAAYAVGFHTVEPKCSGCLFYRSRCSQNTYFLSLIVAGSVHRPFLYDEDEEGTMQTINLSLDQIVCSPQFAEVDDVVV